MDTDGFNTIPILTELELEQHCCQPKNCNSTQFNSCYVSLATNATIKMAATSHHHLHDQASSIASSPFSMRSMDDWAFTSLMACFTRCLFQCLWLYLRKTSASNRIGVILNLALRRINSEVDHTAGIKPVFKTEHKCT